MESNSQRAMNKKSLLSIGALMLCLAALQSPLWRTAQPLVTAVAVRSGGATLIASDGPIAGIAVEPAGQVSAEVVGEREVLVRGKAVGAARVVISSKDGQVRTFNVFVRRDRSQSVLGLISSR